MEKEDGEKEAADAGLGVCSCNPSAREVENPRVHLQQASLDYISSTVTDPTSPKRSAELFQFCKALLATRAQGHEFASLALIERPHTSHHFL